MDVTYHQTIGREELAASIMKIPGGHHAAEITSTTAETGEAVLWSKVFPNETIAVITATVVRQWDYFTACRMGHGPANRPRD